MSFKNDGRLSHSQISDNILDYLNRDYDILYNKLVHRTSLKSIIVHYADIKLFHVHILYVTRYEKKGIYYIMLCHNINKHVLFFVNAA